ncbi:MAG: amidohydrolase [Candidatus Tectomicrobia bacterium]|nr:amidohydrolase [Candidatus Tectomicrobia bacterium]
MRIDVQSHFFPDKLIEKLEKRSAPPNAVRRDGRTMVFASRHTGFPVPPALNDLEEKFRVMEAAGVDVQVLSINVPGPERAGGREADDLAELGHDCLAGITRKYPDKFWGMATLGLGDMDRSLRELDRCLNDLGFRGLQLYSNVLGRPLDDPFFHPLYERCQELDLPIFLHPTAPILSEEKMADYNLIPIVGFLFDTTLAALRLILGGTLKKFPRAKFVLPHVGSTIPYLMGRIDHQTVIMPKGREHIDKAPSEYFRRFYFDTVSTYQPAIDYFFGLYGADRLLFGSDYPWVGMDAAVKLVEGLPAKPSERERIYSQNALDLLRR